jgi:hypothetical protein
MIAKILLVIGILGLLAAFRMSGICSREEEREWEDD